MKFRLFMTVVIVLACHFPFPCMGQEGEGQVEEKLYNFDDMLIDGAFRDPQGMFERARAEAEFEGVLKLERSFMPRVEESAQELSMRP